MPILINLIETALLLALHVGLFLHLLSDINFADICMARQFLTRKHGSQE
jgi:hypothetical protein